MILPVTSAQKVKQLTRFMNIRLLAGAADKMWWMRVNHAVYNRIAQQRIRTAGDQLEAALLRQFYSLE